MYDIHFLLPWVCELHQLALWLTAAKVMQGSSAMIWAGLQSQSNHRDVGWMSAGWAVVTLRNDNRRYCAYILFGQQIRLDEVEGQGFSGHGFWLEMKLTGNEIVFHLIPWLLGITNFRSPTRGWCIRLLALGMGRWHVSLIWGHVIYDNGRHFYTTLEEVDRRTVPRPYGPLTWTVLMQAGRRFQRRSFWHSNL